MDLSVDLVERARAGDAGAFAALYDATAQPLFLYLLGILHHREDAEDALHAAYLSAWEGLASLRRPDRFAAWLFRIGRNAARDAARRARPSHPLPQEVAAPAPGAPPDGLLEGLKDETRALVLLRHGLEWSAEQIAAVL